MELLQPLEGGVLALVSCCDKKQVTHHAGIEQLTRQQSQQNIFIKSLTFLQIQQIHSCSSAAVRSLLRELVQLHDTSYKYTGIA